MTGAARRRRRAASRSRPRRATAHADQVVVATGGYHTPAMPAPGRAAARRARPARTRRDYRQPGACPPGDVLVVGSGQSGCQIAEDLHLAGRAGHLCLGSAPRTARRYRGRDVVDWLDDMGYYNMPVDEHPLQGARARQREPLRDRARRRTRHRPAPARQGGHAALRPAGGDRAPAASSSRADLRAAPGSGRRRRREHQAHDRQVHRRAAASTRRSEAPYVPVWEPAEEPRRLDLAGERHPLGHLVHRLPRRLPLDRGPDLRRPRLPRAPPRRHRRAAASTSSACPGSTPGAPAASRAWPPTRLTSPTTSARRAGKAATPRTATLNELALGS